MMACGQPPQACWHINDAQAWRRHSVQLQVHNNTLLSQEANHELMALVDEGVKTWNHLLANRAAVYADRNWSPRNQLPRLGDGTNSVFFYLNETESEALGITEVQLDYDGYIIEADIKIFLHNIKQLAADICEHGDCQKSNYRGWLGYIMESTVVHELGHALGLRHNDYDSDSIMNSTFRGNFKPAESDQQILECLYAQN